MSEQASPIMSARQAVGEYTTLANLVRAQAVRPLATWLMLVCLLAIHLWLVRASWGLSTGGDDAEPAWRMALMVGARSSEMLAQGEWWRLLSHVWLHASADHLAGNMLTLLFIGMLVERAYGASRMVVVMTLAAVTGALASDAAGTLNAVGMSGAIMGLVGLMLGMLIRYRGELSVRWIRNVGQLVVLSLGMVLVMSFSVHASDHWAHAIGALTGLLCGVGMRSRAVEGPSAYERVWTETARVVLALHIFAWLSMGMQSARCMNDASTWEACYQGALSSVQPSDGAVSESPSAK
jgi:rhomboid protease GluP